MIAAIVVTYNRKSYIDRCIKALLNGSERPNKICIIDNASTDGTENHIKSYFKDYIDKGVIHYHRLPENIGGAGGFHEGLKLALQSDCDYFWLMDDDAEPDKEALKYLLTRADLNQDRCLVSLAVDLDRKELSWGTSILIDEKIKTFEYLYDLPLDRELKAPWAPFLGFLVPRKVVENIGLPRKEYFIWGDDVEYSLRILNSGFEIQYVTESLIYHPVNKKIRLKLLGRNIVLIDAEDWKQYYGLRNDVHTLLSQHRYIDVFRRIVFFFLIWIKRGMKLNRLHYYIRGLYHGIIGRLGRYY